MVIWMKSIAASLALGAATLFVPCDEEKTSCTTVVKNCEVGTTCNVVARCVGDMTDCRFVTTCDDAKGQAIAIVGGDGARWVMKGGDNATWTTGGQPHAIVLHGAGDGHGVKVLGDGVYVFKKDGNVFLHKSDDHEDGNVFFHHPDGQKGGNYFFRKKGGHDGDHKVDIKKHGKIVIKTDDGETQVFEFGDDDIDVDVEALIDLDVHDKGGNVVRRRIQKVVPGHDKIWVENKEKKNDCDGCCCCNKSGGNKSKSSSKSKNVEVIVKALGEHGDGKVFEKTFDLDMKDLGVDFRGLGKGHGKAHGKIIIRTDDGESKVIEFDGDDDDVQIIDLSDGSGDKKKVMVKRFGPKDGEMKVEVKGLDLNNLDALKNLKIDGKNIQIGTTSPPGVRWEFRTDDGKTRKNIKKKRKTVKKFI